MKILFKFHVNQMKIDNFKYLGDADLLADVNLMGRTPQSPKVPEQLAEQFGQSASGHKQTNQTDQHTWQKHFFAN